MCHCGRWFSRLDNLRQHSSTVHADEEIPSDSLAATGTRYQRHIRTERIRQPARPKSQSRTGNFAPQPQSEPGALAQSSQPSLEQLGLNSDLERRERRRPEPIIVPQNALRADAAFSQYRTDTPPESPSSAASPHFRNSALYQRPAPYPPVSHSSSSPLVTPVSTTYGHALDSPLFPTTSFPRASNASLASRRLSMPTPPTPHDTVSMMLPPQGAELSYTSSPLAGPSGIGRRREPSRASAAAEDRRRTWHCGGPVPYHTPMTRDPIARTTTRFARTTLNPEPVDDLPATVSGTAPTMYQPKDRLPSIHSILFDRPSNPEPNHDQARQRNSWTGGLHGRSESIATIPVDRPVQERLGGPRTVPGRARVSHARSISNIETRRRGVYYASNPFSGPWADANTDTRFRSTTPGTISNRNSGCFSEQNIREHRQSFGSSGDSGASDGIITPITSVMDDSRPGIVGEPGDAIYHSEVGIHVSDTRALLTHHHRAPSENMPMRRAK